MMTVLYFQHIVFSSMLDMVASSSFEQEQSYDWSNAIEVILKEIGKSVYNKPHQNKEV